MSMSKTMQLTAAHAQVARLESERVTTQDAMTALQFHLREKDAEIDRLMGIIGASTVEMEKLRKENAELRTGWDNGVAELTKASYAQVSLVTNRLHETERDRDTAISERDAARVECERMRRVVADFTDTVSRAVEAHAARGKGGQQVPYHDDFASAVPSVLSRLQWWARTFSEAISAGEVKP